MDNTYGVLEWTNENGLSGYPLVEPFVLPDFIVDASFTQFDGFIPIFKSVVVGVASLAIVLTTDVGDISAVIPKPLPSYFPGAFSVAVVAGNRQLGFLTFGQGLAAIFVDYANITLTPGISFHSSVVRGVNSSAGVYLIEGYTGDVNIFTGITKPEQSLFFDIAGNTVTWNAGSLPVASAAVPLKTLNGITPLSNAIFIEDSDIIKVTPVNDTLEISVGVPVDYGAISPATTYE